MNMTNFQFNESGVCINPLTLYEIKTPNISLCLKGAETPTGWDVAINLAGSNSGCSRGVWEHECTRTKADAISEACRVVLDKLDAMERDGERVNQEMKNTVRGWMQGQQLTMF
ncbi:MAG: hypothetical protein WCR52_12840 [Bacteroidota bacterium]